MPDGGKGVKSFNWLFLGFIVIPGVGNWEALFNVSVLQGKNSSIISNVLKARQHGTDKHISSCSLGTAFQDLRTVFAQPGWDLSPGLSAEAWVLAPSCFAHQQASISSWGVIEVVRTLCSGLCVLPAASCLCTLFWASDTSFLSWLISQPVKGLLGWRNLSSFTAPSQRCRSHPNSISFPFCSTRL